MTPPAEEERHLAYMRKAMAQARRALAADEVPAGALVVMEDRIIGRGCNQSICRSDPTAHAEMLALRQAARTVGNYRLTSATVYCTLEPCAMCAGALVQARVRLLVYGAKDPKAGAVHSQLNLLAAQFHNHLPKWGQGWLVDEELFNSTLKRRELSGAKRGSRCGCTGHDGRAPDRRKSAAAGDESLGESSCICIERWLQRQSIRTLISYSGCSRKNRLRFFRVSLQR